MTTHARVASWRRPPVAPAPTIRLKIPTTNANGDQPLVTDSVYVGRQAIDASGINDIYAGAAADELIAGYRQLIARVHASGRCIAGVDFDAATRDPADPSRLAPAYDGADGLHPNDAGSAAMGHAPDLDALRCQ